MRGAARAPRRFYDGRYREGYQSAILESGYDACVLAALRWALRPYRSLREPVLDFGCGQGRYLPVLGALLPGAELRGADISPVALELAASRSVEAALTLADPDGLPEIATESIGLTVMVDVIEHVADAGRTVTEIRRVLRPGGHLVLTTPCANPGSIGWLYNRLTVGFEQTPDGIGRFATDEPAHLRRLHSGEARGMLAAAGMRVDVVRWWGHLVTPLADRLESLPLPLRRQAALLDWRLFRRLPNGGAMVVVAHKPQAGDPGVPT